MSDIQKRLLDKRRGEIKDEIFRFLTFWPYFLSSIILFLSIAFFFLRYAEYQYQSNAKIQIIDKSQDSEMALPTAMTIFNRSMVNLENEIGVLGSYELNSRVVKENNYNIKFYNIGNIKTSEIHPKDWLIDYDINFKENLVTEKLGFTFNFNFDNDGEFIVEILDQKGNSINKYNFQNYSTESFNHDLPFELSYGFSNFDGNLDRKKSIKIFPMDQTTNSFMNSLNILESGRNSDQLNLSLIHPNTEICEEYLNQLIYEFDLDGIKDRQLVYKRTMDFVDSRFDFLTEELNQIELTKQKFKEENNLTDISSNASINITQQLSYDTELFSAKSQLDLSNLLKESINEKDFELIPVNIGIENANLNNLIIEYNLIVNNRDRYLLSAGKNNYFVKNAEKQLEDFLNNIKLSIDNYQRTLELNISNIELKEKEFEGISGDIPENEKILRSIDRELEIKESLFLLLFQKREEAAINYAVVKPSIKIIDRARVNIKPVFPNKLYVFGLALIFGILIPFLFLYTKFFLDTKIHTRDNLINNTNDISIIGEIPHIDKKSITNSFLDSSSRNALAESIRMITGNLNFILFNDKKKIKNNLILVTSSVKGEGKTIISANISSVLSSKFSKVLLIGADLRNPQLHKFLDIKKETSGLSDYIYKNDLEWRKLLIKKNKVDILLSGTIPPNPTELLSSNKFKTFLDEVKNVYDYVIIDSAPCLLVSDTFEISKYVDTTIYVVRSNFSEVKLCKFINECKDQEKLSNINLVLNGVGQSQSYGYKYSYQYGYRYGYKYGYNYGYGYGYSEDKSSN
ncbi:MAG: hypothetical protein CBB97_02685 [Candidatus Endolissoclinum sp. TMED37]|nr:MAG: hypothetical protein CBB97_02685 [Candidatus Endolissoclinum sp. TMED37]